jgi:hypothetical protein
VLFLADEARKAVLRFRERRFTERQARSRARGEPPSPRRCR